MRILIIAALLLTLTGCPLFVARKFPDTPPELKTNCEMLKDAVPSEKLSDLLDTVNENYATYYKCKAKNEAWADWYRLQKKNFEEGN